MTYISKINDLLIKAFKSLLSYTYITNVILVRIWIFSFSFLVYIVIRFFGIYFLHAQKAVGSKI